MDTPAERFKKLGDRLIAEGKLYPCEECGHIREATLCLECEEKEEEEEFDI